MSLLINPYIYGSVAPSFSAGAVNFNGTTNSLTKASNMTGLADSKQGLLSVWTNASTDDLFQQLIMGIGSGLNDTVDFYKDDTNNFWILLLNPGADEICELSTTAGYTGTVWYNVLASWDIGANTGAIYVNDSSDGSFLRALDEAVQYTDMASWNMMRSVGGDFFGGGVAEFYFAPGQYLDLSVTANRRKFIDASGHPVDLGTDGSTPTGTAPAVYFHIPVGGTPGDFGGNLGSGGAFTVNGTLTTFLPSP